MSHTNFCCRSGGSNLNAGTRTGNTTVPGTSADFTYTSKVVANGWNAGTGVFTVATGDPASDGVAVGDFASVYVTAGATVATFVARVTARDATTITVSLTAVSGSPPSTDATGATTLKIGGAWAGPSSSTDFPFGFAASTMTNAAGDTPRINFCNDQTYSTAANALVHNLPGPVTFQGFAAAYGDLERATFTCNNAVVPLTCSGANCTFADFIITTSWSSGSTRGLVFSAAECVAIRCVSHDIGGDGFSASAVSSSAFVECEAYLCNRGGGDAGGFSYGGSSLLVRCISHGNTGKGFNSGGSNSVHLHCIADTNSTDGFFSSGVAGGAYHNCDSYGNGDDGFEINVASAAMYYFENCNAVANTDTGFLGVGVLSGGMRNCGTFGNGTATAGLSGLLVEGSLAYTASPYAAPTTGDFRIATTEAIGTGRAAFTQTQASYAGSTSYSDVGALQRLGSGYSRGRVANA